MTFCVKRTKRSLEKKNETGYGPDCKGLYYDFSLEEGDTAIVYLGGSVKAYQVDTIKVDGETYRRLYIDYSDGWMLGTESIGWKA